MNDKPVDTVDLDLRAQIIRIDKLMADTQQKQREAGMPLWQIAAILCAGAAACFAAGAASVKLLGH